MAVTDPGTRLERLINRSAARFNEEFLAALVLVRNSVSLEELARLLELGRFEEAFQSVRIAASRLNLLYAETFVTAGNETARWLTGHLPDIVFDFDMVNTRAVNSMRENQLRLVSAFTEQQRISTQQALVDGITRGLNPRQQALMFRDSIGLTPTQERWVRNYERGLRDLDATVLQRELRDGRFDRTIRSAIDRGEPLSDSQVRRMTQRYRERALKLRSETIARTEALRAANQGAREAYSQALEGGQLGAGQIVRIWNTSLDERVRDFSNGASTSHASMHGQERGFDEPFVSGAGNQALDPGTFGIGAEDINCRCNVSTRILGVGEIPAGIGVQIFQAV